MRDTDKLTFVVPEIPDEDVVLLSNEVLYDNNISAGAFVLYAMIKAALEEHGEYSDKLLLTKKSWSQSKISRCRKELLVHGWITMRNTGLGKYEYEVFDQKLEKPCV